MSARIPPSAEATPEFIGRWVFLPRRRALNDWQARLHGAGYVLWGLAELIDPSIRWAHPVPRGLFAPIADLLDKAADWLNEQAEGA